MTLSVCLVCASKVSNICSLFLCARCSWISILLLCSPPSRVDILFLHPATSVISVSHFVSAQFYPTALKGCRGNVFTHGVRMGGRSSDGWVAGKSFRAIPRKPSWCDLDLTLP